MHLYDKRSLSFPLRLSPTSKEAAAALAREDGISLNHFINLAVAEKISRMESEILTQHQTMSKAQKLMLAVSVVNRKFYS